MIKKNIKASNKAASDRLSRAYELKYSPVAIKFVKEGGDLFGIRKAAQRNTVCAFIRIAAEGGSFYLDKERVSCPGGSHWMGFQSKLTETPLYKFFLGEVEKAKISIGVAEKFLDFLPQPPEPGLYEKILFAPLEGCPFEPDVVVIITVPKHAYRLTVTAYLDEYHLVKTLPLAAACHGSISIPFTTGELNVSMIDHVAREFGNYTDEELLIGIPRPRFISLLDNLKKTPFGARKEPFITGIIKKIIEYLPWVSRL